MQKFGIYLVTAVLLSASHGSMAQNGLNAKNKTPTSCNGKISTERVIKTMSDVHLMRYWAVLLKDQRLRSLKSLNDVQIALRKMDNCEAWDDNETYVVEVKWMLQAVVDNGLTNSFNKLITGRIVVRGEQILQKEKNGAFSEWTALRKNQD